MGGHGLKRRICVSQMKQLLEQDPIRITISGPNTITVALTGWPY